MFKRDMDLVRDLLLQIEDGRTIFDTLSAASARALGLDEDDVLSDVDADKLKYHLDLLENAGFITISFRSGGGSYLVQSISWAGQEYLATIRDPKIWAMTKQGAGDISTFGFDMIKALATGYLKKQVEKHTGLELEL